MVPHQARGSFIPDDDHAEHDPRHGHERMWQRNMPHYKKLLRQWRTLSKLAPSRPQHRASLIETNRTNIGGQPWHWQQNTDASRPRISASLPRARSARLMKAKLNGKPYNDRTKDQVTKAVADCVRRQCRCGIDIVTDGEFLQTGFLHLHPGTA